MAASYYVRTARPDRARPRLLGRLKVDLLVVGAGCTGLSTALHAAAAGLSVAVLEGGRVAWGASGRNGGQMIPGLRKGAAELVRLYGRERAKALFDLSLEARALMLQIIAANGIECDLRLTGHLLGAVRSRDQRALETEAEALVSAMSYKEASVLSAVEARRFVDTPYVGALLDRGGGHLHPLNYALGLAGAAEAAGAQLYEKSPVQSLAQTPGRVCATTPEGSVEARHAVLAGDALLEGLVPEVSARIMPVAAYIVATEPLRDPLSLIPSNAAVSDTRFVVNYYRLTADGRLLFGGGERYTPRPPADIKRFVRPFIERVFPELRGAPIAFGWGGLVSVTTSRLPHVGRVGEILYAHGYSGLGVMLSTLAGKLLAEELQGRGRGFELFAGVQPAPFPGGVSLRGPLHVLGMLWYALRDRL